MTKVSVANRKDKREVFLTVLVQMTPPVAGSPPVYGQRRATLVKARRERGQRDAVAAGLVGFMLARGNHKWGPAVSHTHEGWVVRWAFSPKWTRPICDL
jgi:hypothetical protein